MCVLLHLTFFSVNNAENIKSNLPKKQLPIYIIF